MEGFEGGFEAVAGDVGVAVGGADIFMAEHVLNEAKIGPVFSA